MVLNKFFGENNKFGNSPSMFDCKGKLIKNHIKWENYFFQNENSNINSITDSQKKYLHKYFSIN